MTDPKQMPKLLPCPFCGGEAAHRGCREVGRWQWIVCLVCGAHTNEQPDGRGQDGMLACAQLWNRRILTEATKEGESDD